MKNEIDVNLRNLPNGNVLLELQNSKTGTVIERTEMDPDNRNVKHVADRIGRSYNATFNFDGKMKFGKVRLVNRKLRMAIQEVVDEANLN